MEYLHWYMILVVLLLSILALKSPSLALVFVLFPPTPNWISKYHWKRNPVHIYLELQWLARGTTSFDVLLFLMSYVPSIQRTEYSKIPCKAKIQPVNNESGKWPPPKLNEICKWSFLSWSPWHFSENI